MAKAPQRIQIKPAFVDVGRGPQLATVPYPPVSGTPTRVLQPEGDAVLFEGAARSYWQRRLNEGSVELADPSKQVAEATTEKKEGKH